MCKCINNTYIFIFFHITEFASRRCDTEGRWEGRFPDQENPTGWTNFTGCYTAEIKALMDRLNPSSESDLMVKYNFIFFLMI